MPPRLPIRPRRGPSALALALALLGARVAAAQGLLTSQAEVLTSTSQPVPGLPAVFFGGANTFDSPVIDAQGYVLFRARLTGQGIGALNERALMRGRNAQDLAIWIQSGAAAPGLPGLTLNSASMAGPGGSLRSSADGRALFGSFLAGAGVLAANDSALFGGLPGALAPIVREGDVAPGTVGARFSANFNAPTVPATGINSHGQVVFTSATSGGDTVSANNAGWWTGAPGALKLMQRKGDTVLGGAVIGFLGTIAQINDAGQVLHDELLSTSVGSASTANDRTLWIWLPGIGNFLVLREGDPAPGTAGGQFGRQDNNWLINVGPNAFNRFGTALVQADLFGGNVVAGVNDRGLYLVNIGGETLVARRGDAAPGTDATFNTFNNTSLSVNAAAQIAFAGGISGGSSGPGDDSGVWTTAAGALQLVAREGAAAPETAGAVFGVLTGQSLYFNDRGQVLFTAPLLGGDVGANNDSALYAWDPALGLRLVVRAGDPLEVAPGITRIVQTFEGVLNNNGEGASLTLDHDGRFVLRLDMLDGTSAIARARIGSLNAVPSELSVASGGVQKLFLDAGAARAGGLYLLAGSLSGSSPGFAIGGLVLPLNPDAYFAYTLASPNAPPFAHSLGVLDAQGRASASLALPALSPSLVGLVAQHAFAVLELASGALSFASEPAALTLVP